jgi:hypothetical protein
MDDVDKKIKWEKIDPALEDGTVSLSNKIDGYIFNIRKSNFFNKKGEGSVKYTLFVGKDIVNTKNDFELFEIFENRMIKGLDSIHNLANQEIISFLLNRKRNKAITKKNIRKQKLKLLTYFKLKWIALKLLFFYKSVSIKNKLLQEKLEIVFYNNMSQKPPVIEEGRFIKEKIILDNDQVINLKRVVLVKK